MIALSLTLILLASAFAMTALAFVKITGETLLGLPRNLAVVAREKQGDVPWSMRTVLALLAMLCLVFGLMPWLLIPWLATVSQSLGYDTSILQVRPSRVVIYLTNPTGKTFAELNSQEKNRVSHRGKALQEVAAEFSKILTWLEARLAESKPPKPDHRQFMHNDWSQDK